MAAMIESADYAEVRGCPCGRAHLILRIAADLIVSNGPLIAVSTLYGTWRVPRIWIAAHGLTTTQLPGLASQYGWQRVPPSH